MIRQSRERPSGELELLIRPMRKCHLSSNNDTDSEDAYDNGLLHQNPLEQSLDTIRDDLTTGHLIEQYEVRYFIKNSSHKLNIILFPRHFNDEKMVLHLKSLLVKIIIIEIVIKMLYHTIKHVLY